MKPLAALVASLSPLLWSTGDVSLAGEFVLVAKGSPPATIAVYAGAPPRTRAVADILAGYVEQISGQRPPVVEGEPTPLPERVIWIGIQPSVQRVFPTVDLEFEHPEEILIAANERHLVNNAKLTSAPDPGESRDLTSQ
jgi:hypothetical protein